MTLQAIHSRRPRLTMACMGFHLKAMIVCRLKALSALYVILILLILNIIGLIPFIFLIKPALHGYGTHHQS